VRRTPLRPRRPPGPRRKPLGRALPALVLTDTADGLQVLRAFRYGAYQGRNLTLTTRLGDIDVVQRLAGVPRYAELAADAQHATIGGVPIAVASREHLIAMKQAGGSAQDRADLERLAPPAGP
jgi:hypothetical protein